MTMIRLLMLEDSPDDALLTVEALRRAGLEIEWRRICGRDELVELLPRGWDAVLCDYRMPCLRAEDALEIVGDFDPNLPFILVSGTVDPRIALDLMRHGMHEYVLKDDLDRLAPALEREIRDARHRRNEQIAKAELFQLQKKFRETVEQSSVGIAHLDRKRRVFWANQHLTKMLGYSMDEILGMDCSQLTWPDDYPDELERQEKLLRGEQDEYRAEKRYRRKDGSYLWTLLTLTAIRDEQDQVEYFTAVIQDISEKHAAEQLAAENERLIRAVLDSLPFQIAVVEPDGEIRMVNRSWAEFALDNGADPSAVGVGTNYLDACPARLRETLARVISGEQASTTLEYPCHSPDEQRWFLMNAAPLATEKGGVVITHVNITDRVLAEHDLARHEQEQRTIIETMGEGLYTLDTENRILFANPRFCEMVGYEQAELAGRDVIELLALPEDREQIRQVSKRRLEGRSDHYDSRMRHRDGHEILITMSAVPRLDQEGNVIGKLCVANDVTENRNAQREQEKLRRQIEELNRLESLGKLAGKMAHEFNNVLMGIQPFTEVIERSVNGHETVSNATRQIAEAVRRGTRISREVLQFARQSPPERHVTSCDTLLEQAGALGSALLRGMYRIEIEPTDETLHVSIDREQIDQVFTNLIINARDAMEAGSTITLGARRDPAGSTYEFGFVDRPESFVHFTVTDQGCGVPESMLKTIFEPLITTKRRGTGLGLAIVHQMITAHGGLIFAESIEEVGTTFHIFLPAAEGEHDQVTRPPESPDWTACS